MANRYIRRNLMEGSRCIGILPMGHRLKAYVLRLRPAPATQCDQQSSHPAGDQCNCRRLRNYCTDYTIREIGGYGLEVNPHVRAIEKRVLVVATGRTDAVSTASGRIKRTA